MRPFSSSILGLGGQGLGRGAAQAKALLLTRTGILLDFTLAREICAEMND